MKKILSILIFLILICYSSCTLFEQKSPLKIDSLAGLWKSEGNLIVYEYWELVSEATLRGKSFSINGNDTLLFETLRIAKINDTLAYFATVVDQNNSEEIAFKLVTSKNERWVFENLTHDYPNRIIYHLTSDSSFVARIENVRGNQSKEFHFKKIKE